LEKAADPWRTQLRLAEAMDGMKNKTKVMFVVSLEAKGTLIKVACFGCTLSES
jgi:hypothetical protein